MSVLLLSTYDLGRQPFGLASTAAWLRREHIEVATCDLSRERLDPQEVTRAALIAFYLPMHTATRLALPLIDRARAINPDATLCAFGLYAPLNEPVLRQHGVSEVIGPEAERDLVNLAASLHRNVTSPTAPHRYITSSDRDITTSPHRRIPRLSFIRPDRTTLTPLARYASLQMPDGSRRVVGATDATRGCKHLCRHCPIVPIYGGQFRVVPVDVVLADIDQQVAAGAEHITFGDPDFFNGPAHARRIIEALHARHPRLTYDVTIKVEHLLKHRDLLPRLAATGCAFITSAVESVDDGVLRQLDKGHTRRDFVEAVTLCRAAGVEMSPTFVAFTPWTTLESYRELLRTVAMLDLIEQVAPVQWGIRLLVTQGSRLLELDDIHARVAPFDGATLTYPWVHDDPAVDALQQAIMRLVGVRVTRSRAGTFDAVCALAGLPPRSTDTPRRARAAIPYLNEPWYC